MMTHALLAPTLRTAFDLAAAIRTVPYAAFTLVVAGVLACGVGIVNMPSSRNAGAATTSAAPAQAVPVAVRGRCPTCGVVESIRSLDAAGNTSGTFEFTVRLRDGSVRVSRTAGRGSWRAGDRIMLMGGPGPSAH